MCGDKMIDEKTLQERFYAQLCDIDGTIAEVSNNTDGVIRGTLIENKLVINNPAQPLGQAVSYLSKFRNLAKDVPGRIMTIDFSRKFIRIYDSSDFLSEIERPCYKAASKIKDFYTDVKPIKEYCYEKNLGEVVKDLQYDQFLRVHVDFYNIVANAQRFYMENPSASTKKLAFRKELLNPQYLNIYPISESDLQEKEKTEFFGVIDCLNDKILQKELGAFYTPEPYVKLSTQMVRDAIGRIKKLTPDNDYIILDRCAGTGNLESFLTDCNVSDIRLGDLHKYVPDELLNKYMRDKKSLFAILEKPIGQILLGELEAIGKTNMSIYDYLFDDELSHCVLSTYETWEWTILNAKYADKVRMIIPPEGTINKYEPLVVGADALSEVFITAREGCNLFGDLELNELYVDSIKRLNSYVNSQNCNVILYENPPFRNSTLDSSLVTKSNKANYVYNKIKDADLSNQFIWSGWEYYLKKTNDYFILYSPIKYWKTRSLGDRKYINGYVFNRDFFGEAGPSAITCIEWKNELEIRQEITLGVYDIVTEEGRKPNKIGKVYKLNSTDSLSRIRDITIKKVYKDISAFYDKGLSQNKAVVCGYNGYEDARNKSIAREYVDNIAYLIVRYFSYELPRQNCCLIRSTHYRGGGFPITADNLLTKAPLFVCGRNDEVEGTWYLNGNVYKSADGGTVYEQDREFLKKSLLYTALTNKNHCLSFVGSDGRVYRNEICLGQNTIADKILAGFQLDEQDSNLVKEWMDVLELAKSTCEYKKLLHDMPNVTLGLYQIEQEIDVYEYLGKTYSKLQKVELVKHLSVQEKKLICHKYPDLVKEIEDLKRALKSFYKSELQEKLYEYELLK